VATRSQWMLCLQGEVSAKIVNKQCYMTVSQLLVGQFQAESTQPVTTRSRWTLCRQRQR
jgi:hypothetical protein